MWSGGDFGDETVEIGAELAKITQRISPFENEQR